MSRLPTAIEQAFLMKLAYLLIERRGFGLSFELEGPRLRVTAHPPYAEPAHMVVRVDSGRLARSDRNCLVTVHDVAIRLTQRVKKVLG